MSRVKCLAILCLSSTAPISRPISALPRSGWRLRATAMAMRARSRSVAASRSSRLPARPAAEPAVAADDEPLARELGRSDAGHIAVIKQRHLQGAAVEQCFDCRGAQGGNPVEPGRFDVLGDPLLGDHPPVTDQDDMVESEALLQLGQLTG